MRSKGSLLTKLGLVFSLKRLKMYLETKDVTLLFDPITNVCIGGFEPDGRMLLAPNAKFPMCSGRYRMKLVAHPTDDGVCYEFFDTPFGKTVEELFPLAAKRKVNA